MSSNTEKKSSSAFWVIYLIIWLFLFAAVWVDRRTIIFIHDPDLRHTLRSVLAGMAIPFGFFMLKEDPKIGVFWFMGTMVAFLYVLFGT